MTIIINYTASRQVEWGRRGRGEGEKKDNDDEAEADVSLIIIIRPFLYTI